LVAINDRGFDYFSCLFDVGTLGGNVMSQEKDLLIIAFEDSKVEVRTFEPEKEIERAFLRGGVLAIIKNNTIIYTAPGKLS